MRCNMELSKYLLIVFIAGAIGGIVNALLSDNGFILPKKEMNGKVNIIRPGYLGNIFVGGISAIISWGLYGPFAAAYIIGGINNSNMASIGLSLSSLVGALLVGVGGARWLTNEVDKTLLRAAASGAAAGKSNVNSAISISSASPAEAFRIGTSSVE